ncbi:MFS transporter [Sulfurimonas sp.]|jgi:Na+/melibiose symporter-like transporter|uniref:MFS transporter n=1 Tax=Sulfurimonas sp. TaxID=2022749 RepID=UPI0025FC776C|nr:MFS transporter [Sulfurimonas sp.]MBT5934039.1 MFS transporter [Sulfurimonas sp.]
MFNSKVKLASYGVPAVAISLLGLPLYVYLPTYYAQNVGLGVFSVGVVLFFARVFDMFIDPLIGYISDSYMSRKVMMLLGAILLYITFYALTHPAEESGVLYLLFLSLGVYSAWSLLSIPYFALGSDISNSYHENTLLSSSREIFNIFGVLLALSMPYVYDVAEDAGASLLVLFDTLSIILPISLLLCFVFLKEEKRIKNSIGFKKVYNSFIIEILDSKRVFIAFFLNNFANAIPATLFLFYVSLVIKSEELSGLLLLVYFGSGIVTLPLWIYLSKKISKKTAWMLSMSSASLFFFFVIFLGEGDIVYFTIITVFSGMSLGADIALPASIQADIAQRSTKKYGQVSGTLFGFFAMLTKLSLAFAVGVSFSLLGLFDFSADAPNARSLFVLSLLYGVLPVILKISAILVLKKYQEN